jgi:hypothetical protein
MSDSLNSSNWFAAFKGAYPITRLCEQFGVCRNRRRAINADKVKQRALVSEKHELSNGSAG